MWLTRESQMLLLSPPALGVCHDDITVGMTKFENFSADPYYEPLL